MNEDPLGDLGELYDNTKELRDKIKTPKKVRR